MASFFSFFPKVNYDIANKQYSNFQTVTDVLFRVRVVRELLNNTSAYMEYYIRDGDRPDVLAEKVYDNPEAHWLILYANDMVDPQYDWPLSAKDFIRYIRKKYGSVEYAKTHYHHYEKVVKRENSRAQTTNEMRYIISEEQLTVNNLLVPFDTYENLEETQSVKTIELGDATIIETTYRQRVSYYDYENEQNEKKKSIKIIKAQFYPQIMLELEKLTGSAPSYLRRLLD